MLERGPFKHVSGDDSDCKKYHNCRKKCEICGGPAEKDERCRDCSTLPKIPKSASCRVDDYFIEGTDNLRKEVFQGAPETLSKIFMSKENRIPLSYGMLRRFFELARQARDMLQISKASARESLERLKRFAEYQKRRKQISVGFFKFIHNRCEEVLNKENSDFEKYLNGFVELLTSIVAYSANKEGR